MESLGRNDDGIRVKQLVKEKRGGPPLRANDFFDGYLSQRILCCGPSNVGKTNLWSNFVLRIAAGPTDVYIFSGTAKHDPTVRRLHEKLDKKFRTQPDEEHPEGCERPGAFEVHPSLYKDGTFLPSMLMNDRELSTPLVHRGSVVPRCIIVLDDLTTELRTDTNVDMLFKTVRHINSVLITSIHDLTDLRKSARQELTRTYMYAGASQERVMGFLDQWGFHSSEYSHSRLYELYAALLRIEKKNYLRMDKATGKIWISVDNIERPLSSFVGGGAPSTAVVPTAAAAIAAPVAAPVADVPPARRARFGPITLRR